MLVQVGLLALRDLFAGAGKYAARERRPHDAASAEQLAAPMTIR